MLERSTTPCIPSSTLHSIPTSQMHYGPSSHLGLETLPRSRPGGGSRSLVWFLDPTVILILLDPHSQLFSLGSNPYYVPGFPIPCLVPPGFPVPFLSKPPVSLPSIGGSLINCTKLITCNCLSPCTCAPPLSLLLFKPDEPRVQWLASDLLLSLLVLSRLVFDSCFLCYLITVCCSY